MMAAQQCAIAINRIVRQHLYRFPSRGVRLRHSIVREKLIGPLLLFYCLDASLVYLPLQVLDSDKMLQKNFYGLYASNAMDWWMAHTDFLRVFLFAF